MGVLNCLYRQAGHAKKIGFSLGEAGVTISTVIGKLSSFATWMANLGAIVLGGVGYSVFKNMETAQSIVMQN